VAYAASGASPKPADIDAARVNPGILSMAPGIGPLYSQFSVSPVLGRTLTSFRYQEEGAFWNPSLLVRSIDRRLTLAGGKRNELRVSGYTHLPEVGERSPPYYPRVVSGGFAGHLGEEDQEIVSVSSRERIEHTNKEYMAFLGLGFALSTQVSIGANASFYEQHFGPLNRVTQTVSDSAGTRTERFVVDGRVKKSVWDGSLSLTWDARPDLRLGVAAYHLGGTEAIDTNGLEVPLARGAFGAAWTRGRFEIGAEASVNPGKMGAAGGVNYRLAPSWGLDLSGATRFSTIQGGIDYVDHPLAVRARLRHDDLEESAVFLSVGVGG
jgi:hypothetical protein